MTLPDLLRHANVSIVVLVAKVHADYTTQRGSCLTHG